MRTSKRKREAQQATAPEAASEAKVITLPAACTFREAGELKVHLLDAVSAPQMVKLDASAMQRVDAAGMQVICAFVRDRQADKLPLTWSSSCAALNEAARLLGIESLLSLPAATA